MDKKRLTSIKAKAQEVADGMPADTDAAGNPPAIRLLAETVVALIEALEKD